MLDHKLTQAIQSWLDKPQEDRSLSQGAELLLRLNRNRYMHTQIVAKRNISKLEYELKKHLRIRLEGLTVQQVATMERKALPLIRETLSKGAPQCTAGDEKETQAQLRGKRPDHETLPEHIKAIYARNGEVYFKMKSLFHTLKQMANAMPCDRHELLTQLVELDKEYRAKWNAYDSWSADSENSCTRQPDIEDGATARLILAARKYLSLNKPRLASAQGEAADRLRTKMQERVALLLKAGQSFDSTFQRELESLGLAFTEVSGTLN